MTTPADIVSDAPIALDQGALDAAVDSLLGTPAAPAPVVPPVAEPAATPPVVEAAPPAETPAPTNTLAELAKAERERRLGDIQKERDALAAQLAAERTKKPEPAAAPAKSGPPDLATLRKLMLTDPNAVAQHLGFKDAGQLARYNWGKALGDASKIDVSQDERALSIENRLESQEAELARLRAERDEFAEKEKQRQAMAEYQHSLATLVESHVDALPHTKAFLSQQREETLSTLAQLGSQMRAEDPHVGNAVVAEEFERRLAGLAPKKVKELERDLALWKTAMGQPSAPAGNDKAPAPVNTPAKTLTSATAAGSTTPSSAPATEEERLADAVRFWEEQTRKEQAQGL